MNTGMMWFDNDPKTPLPEKIERAADYYRQKYGRMPDTCLVNPNMMTTPEMHAGHIVVKPLQAVLPGHFWIGIEDKLPLGAD